MLLKRAVLDRIAAGEIRLVFRRWRRPTVKSGGTLRTAAGMLDIVSVTPVSRRSITVADAARAGFPSRAALLRELDQRDDGDLYRIEVRPGGDDPLEARRADADLGADDVAAMDAALARLDAASPRGPWTRAVLELIEARPFVRAPDLAAAMGRDTPSFKNDVRKLKRHGLTISHSPGYELSPRGRAYLAASPRLES